MDIYGFVRGGVFVAMPDGRYYLDEQAAHQRMCRKQVVMIVVLSIVLAVLLILYVLGVIRAMT